MQDCIPWQCQLSGGHGQEVDEEVVHDDKKDEIDDILNEYDEDDFNKFEELDEDLY